MVDEASSRLPDFSFLLLTLIRKLLHTRLPASSPGIATMLAFLVFSTKDWISNFSSLIPNSGRLILEWLILILMMYSWLVNQSGENEYGWNSWSLETLRKSFVTWFLSKHIP